MNKEAVKEKLLNIQAQIESIKRSLNEKPDFDIDDTNWQRVKSDAKKTRRSIYRRVYAKK